MRPRFSIDCFHEELAAYPPEALIVGIDVIRSTTTAITCVDAGRRCFVVPNLEEASHWQARLERPLLVGELGGNMPFGFDRNNSPVAMANGDDLERPAILLSSSGTRLLSVAATRHATLVACLRNWQATVAEVVRRTPETVVLLGAGTRGEFRSEDQLCAAWIGAGLLQAGFDVDGPSRELVDRWRDEGATAIADGPSASYLRRSGQEHDLVFVLEHVDDLVRPFEMDGNEVVGA